MADKWVPTIHSVLVVLEQAEQEPGWGWHILEDRGCSRMAGQEEPLILLAVTAAEEGAAAARRILQDGNMLLEVEVLLEVLACEEEPAAREELPLAHAMAVVGAPSGIAKTAGMSYFGGKQVLKAPYDMTVWQLQAATLKWQKAAPNCVDMDAALTAAAEVVVVARWYKESGDRRPRPRKWKAVIAWGSVWHSPFRVLEWVVYGFPAGYQPNCLHVSWKEARHVHDYKAEEDQAGSDRSGSRQHWTTNFVKLHCPCGDVHRIPLPASLYRYPGS